MIFDLPQVDIFKDSGALCWIVRNPETNAIIVRVSFAYLFSWESLISSHHANDLFSIIEAGIGIDGWLTPEELSRLEQAQPGLTSQSPLVDRENLDSLRENWVISHPSPSAPYKGAPRTGSSKKRNLPPLQGKRKFIL